MVMVPIIIIVPSNRSSYSYYLVVFSRFLRFINCAIILTKYYKLGHTDVDRQIKIVMMTMVLLMYVSSGVYGVVEDQSEMFHDNLYFVVVTLFTVGYGDIYPSSFLGEMIVIIIILLTIIIIPQQTNELLRLMNLQSRYRRTTYKSVDVRHIIVTGSVGL